MVRVAKPLVGRGDPVAVEDAVTCPVIQRQFLDPPSVLGKTEHLRVVHVFIAQLFVAGVCLAGLRACCVSGSGQSLLQHVAELCELSEPMLLFGNLQHIPYGPLSHVDKGLHRLLRLPIEGCPSSTIDSFLPFSPHIDSPPESLIPAGTARRIDTWPGLFVLILCTSNAETLRVVVLEFTSGCFS